MPKKAAKKKAAKKKIAKKRAVKKSRRVGRPKGTGKFGCATKLIRVPSKMEKEIMAFVQSKLDAH